MDMPLAIDLARIQFAFTVSFHIIFPAFTIGLASYLAVLEALWLVTGRQVYIDTFRYWIKIFAVTFAMGVVSGIVMSYQFGTNWSVFSDKTGPILGPLMGYEVMSAFFLEAGFLGVMLFGMDRVGKGLHFLATLLVAFGTFFSAFWILSVNSWMQTPAGYAINEVGQFVPANWFEIVFNPSFPYRLVHMVLAAYLTTAFVVGAVGAWHILKDSRNESARLMFSMAMWMAVIVAPIQVIAGDMHGLNTLEHQPAKIAAMEGHFETRKGAPLILFGLPNMETEETDYAIEIPGLGSYHPDPPLGRRSQRLESLAQGGAALCARSLLELPRHGRHRPGDGWARPLVARRPHAWRSLRAGPSAPRGDPDGANGFRCRHCRLDHHRDGPPALHGLRAPEDDQLGFPDRCTRRLDLASGVHRRLLHRVRSRRLLHNAPDG